MTSSCDCSNCGDNKRYQQIVLRQSKLKCNVKADWHILRCTNCVGTIGLIHYNDIIMSRMASQITGVWIVYSTICSGLDKRKHRSSESQAFVRVTHRWPVNIPHKGTVTRKTFPFDDAIMYWWRISNVCALAVNVSWAPISNRLKHMQLFGKRKSCLDIMCRLDHKNRIKARKIYTIFQL